MLFCIWILPIENDWLSESAKYISGAFEDIFERSGRKPRLLRTDLGSEFKNVFLRKTLQERNITHMYANHRTKAAFAERFIRTLKEKLWRYFTATNKERYVDRLQDFVRGYNRSVHSTTGVAPEKVNHYNGEKVWRRLYGHRLKGSRTAPGPRAHFAVGDRVRISRDKAIFSKGYSANWSREIFTVAVVKGGGGGIHRYVIEDGAGEVIKGTFKREELQKVATRERKVKRVVRRGRGSDAGRHVT